MRWCYAWFMPFYISVHKCVEHTTLSVVAKRVSIQVHIVFCLSYLKTIWHSLAANKILYSTCPDISGQATLKTTNSSPKFLFSQWGKKGKFSLFKMVVHNPSTEHKRVCQLGKMDGGPHACLNKKVFNPSSRSSSQGSMILKTGRELGLVNVMDRQESLKAPRG